jgi:hypothetical protein
VGIGLVLRHFEWLRSLAASTETEFVVFVSYGLALSLICASSNVMRGRDTIILTLAATLIWGIFVEGHRLLMLRFLAFAWLILAGLQLSHRLVAASRVGPRVLVGTLLPAAFCGIGGLVYYGVMGFVAPLDLQITGGLTGGLVWGGTLGLAIGLGISAGNGIKRWLMNRAKS